MSTMALPAPPRRKRPSLALFLSALTVALLLLWTGVPLLMAVLWSLVDPEDVRWIFLSHDDVDHTGNLDETLSACPNAQLVCNWAMVERHTNCFEFPLHRCRWIADGEALDIGDRTLQALRPPVYDSPTTRGLFDPTTGVYWAVDTFASLSPGFVATADDVPHDLWTESLLQFNRMISPWHTLVDPAKWDAYVDQVEALGATTVASGHSAALRGDRLAEAFRLVRTIPTMPEAELPVQADLDALLAAHAVGAA